MSISRNEDTHCNGTILSNFLKQDSFKDKKEVRKKTDTDTTIKTVSLQHPPKEKKEKKSGKGKQKTTELENISEAVLTEAEQLKIITKRSRKNDVKETKQMMNIDDVNMTMIRPLEDDDEEQTNQKMMFTTPLSGLSSSDDEDQMTIKLKVQATQEIEDTHVTLTPVNLDGQQQSSSVSSGFVSNILNPNQDTGVDDIFEQHAEATSLTDTPVTAIVEPSFTTTTNQLSQHRITSSIQITSTTILTPNTATTQAPRYKNLPKLASLNIGGFSPLNYDRIEKSLILKINNFLDSIDEGDEEKLELKKILILDKMEANNIYPQFREFKGSSYKALVDVYEADKILLDTYGDMVTIKRPRDGADDDQEPSAGIDRGSKRRRSGKEPVPTSAPKKRQTTPAGKYYNYKEFEIGVHDEQAEEEVQHLHDWFQQPTRLPSPDHAWNKSVLPIPSAVHESVQPWQSNLHEDKP
ncbi:hypothetical protein Tco_1015563 [Tanacetum coccineum]|uniref:Uncharacterized protein n=1 Tax=Tanacetum coccineum TaxID=301880 RepID=A0ABQ5FMH5_9ASTR